MTAVCVTLATSQEPECSAPCKSAEWHDPGDDLDSGGRESLKLFFGFSQGVAKVFRRRSHTAEARVLFRGITWDFWWVENMGILSAPRTSVMSCVCHLIKVTRSFSIDSGSHQNRKTR